MSKSAPDRVRVDGLSVEILPANLFPSFCLDKMRDIQRVAYAEIADLMVSVQGLNLADVLDWDEFNRQFFEELDPTLDGLFQPGLSTTFRKCHMHARLMQLVQLNYLDLGLNHQLLKSFFGFSFPAVIEAYPHTLLIRIADSDAWRRITEPTWGTSFGSVGGFAAKYPLFLPDISGKVRVNVIRETGDGQTPEKIRHESQHASNAFSPLLDVSFDHPFPKTFESPHSDLVDSVRLFLNQQNFLGLKDEVSAYLSCEKTAEDIKASFARGRQRGLFDFHGRFRHFLDLAKRHAGFNDADMDEVLEGMIAFDVDVIVDRSCSGLELMVDKGYGREWALFFLSAEHNLIRDWLTIAEGIPSVEEWGVEHSRSRIFMLE